MASITNIENTLQADLQGTDNNTGVVVLIITDTAPPKQKCYKIVDGMYVQVPCWADWTGKQ